MKVRRVRLLAAPEPCCVELTLAAPRARRARTGLGRPRVRSFWIEAGAPRPASPLTPVAEPGEDRERPGGTASPASPIPAAEEFLRRLRELLRPDLRVVLGAQDWPHPLFPFQEHGTAFLYERNAALLADEQGLGKTVQALAAISLLLATGSIRQALILCPAALVGYWEREARRWLARLAGGVAAVRGSPVDRHFLWSSPLPLLVAGYEVFRTDWDAGRIPRRTWDLVILDEAQRIKNAETDLARACKALPRERSWALTGTPLENRVDDLLSILEWLTGRSPAALSAGLAVREAQHTLQLRRKKEAVATQLPPKTVIDVLVELEGTQRVVYDRLAAEGVLELSDRGEELQLTHVLAVLTRLKQACNFCPVSGASAKWDFVRPQVAELLASGRQALLFSQFTDEHFGVRRLARELGEAAGCYHGGMSARARERAVQAFDAGETPVLAVSIRAGGVGLNLQRASYVFHFDRWWNPAAEWQAEDRAHRLGQELPVTVYRLIAARTVEERIHQVLESKSALFREVVEGAPVPAGAGLTLGELLGVLDLPLPPHLRTPPDRGNVPESWE